MPSADVLTARVRWWLTPRARIEYRLAMWAFGVGWWQLGRWFANRVLDGIRTRVEP